MAKHQCIQFGVCPRADTSDCFEVDSTFTCSRSPEDPDCRAKLEELKTANGSKMALKIGVPTLILLVGAGAYFYFSRPAETPVSSTPPTVDELLKEVWPWLR